MISHLFKLYFWSFAFKQSIFKKFLFNFYKWVWTKKKHHINKDHHHIRIAYGQKNRICLRKVKFFFWKKIIRADDMFSKGKGAFYEYKYDRFFFYINASTIMMNSFLNNSFWMPIFSRIFLKLIITEITWKLRKF